MNNQASAEYIVRIPLTTSASIHNTNALTVDWESIVPKNGFSYILGNLPFLGYSVMNREQKTEVETVFENMKNCGILDYVTAWYKKAALYIQGTVLLLMNLDKKGKAYKVVYTMILRKQR